MMAKAKDTAPEPEQQALPAPIVMTLTADMVITNKAVGTAAPYSWSKDGGAASSAQWVLPAYDYDVTLDWTMESSGTTKPVYASGANTGWIWTTVAQTALSGPPTWVDDGDGTFSTTYRPTPPKRVTNSKTGIPWDIRYHGSSSVSTDYPITIRAGSTVTITAVLAAAPAVHTIGSIAQESFRVNWSGGGNRDIEVAGAVVLTSVPTGRQVDGLTPGTLYATRTRTNDGVADPSSWTAVVNATTTALAAAPSLHTVTDALTSASPAFNVAWSPTTARDIEIDGTIVSSDDTSPYGHPATPSTAYSIRTRASNPESVWTAAVVHTTAAKLAAPVVTATLTGENEITVSWPAVPGATSYRVYHDYSAATESTDCNPCTSPHVFGGIHAGISDVTVNVLAFAADKFMSSATTTVDIPAVPLDVPVVTATVVSPTEMRLDWVADDPNVRQYDVRWDWEDPVYGTDYWEVNGVSPATHTATNTRFSPGTEEAAWTVTAVGNVDSTPVEATGTTSFSEGPPPIEPSPPPSKHSEPLPMSHKATPAPPLDIGLYAAVDWQTGDRFTLAGVEIEPANVGGEVALWDVGWCEDPLDESKTPTPREDPLDPFTPVVPYAVDECGLSPANQEGVPTRARHMLSLLEPVRVEEAFAQRLLTEAPPVSGTFDLVAVVGEIEAELAARGLRGYIHASPKFAAELAAAQLGVTTTPLGIATWVFGGGYVDILGDTLVVTTAPQGWRSEVVVNSVVDHTHNRVLAVAERTVLIGYEAVILSVGVTPAVVTASTAETEQPAKSEKAKSEPAKSKK